MGYPRGDLRKASVLGDLARSQAIQPAPGPLQDALRYEVAELRAWDGRQVSWANDPDLFEGFEYSITPLNWHAAIFQHVG